MLLQNTVERKHASLDLVLRLLAALALLLTIALLAGGLIVLLSLLRASNPLTTSVEGLRRGAEETITSLRDSAGRAAEPLADRLDPTHPPRASLDKDPEFAALWPVRAAESVVPAATYQLTLREVRKRPDAANADEGVFAVIHGELVVPRDARVLGVTVRTDRAEADFYLYKGESFRLGYQYYKVNWLSWEQQEIAIAQYREPDRVQPPLKFTLE